jgi:hypothetical protein
MKNRNLCCIVNLPERKDRYNNIVQTFKFRKEFGFKVFRPSPQALGSVSLWITIKKIIETVDPGLDFFIFCEDDHVFTSHYSFDLFQKCINEAQQLDADILCGGVSWFKTGMQVSKNLFWVEKFSGLQFTVIFKKFYQTILDASFTEFDQADYRISGLTDKKFVIYPFISIQKDFGYSDVTKRNHEERRVERLFEEASEKFSLLRKVKANYSNNRIFNLTSIENETEQISLPLYVIADKLKDSFDIQCFGFSLTTIQILNNHCLEQWMALRKCIDIAKINEDDFIIITFDSFVLKKDFRKFILINDIIKSNSHSCDILLGNIEKFNHAVPVNESIFWIDSFSQSSFIILFASAYEKILSNPPAPDEVNIYNYLSYITSNKMAVYPFVLESKNLIKEHETDIKFQEHGKQLAVYQKVFQEYILKERV